MQSSSSHGRSLVGTAGRRYAGRRYAGRRYAGRRYAARRYAARRYAGRTLTPGTAGRRGAGWTVIVQFVVLWQVPQSCVVLTC